MIKRGCQPWIPIINQPSDNLVPVARYRNLRTANERALVILAMELSYWLLEEDGEYVLYVERQHEAAVRSHLARNEKEAVFRRMVTDEPYEEMGKPSVFSFLLYALVLSLFFLFTAADPGTREWLFAQGAVDSEKIAGEWEWWRALTALTLHADIAHLVGNLVGGIFFGYFVVSLFGSGLGWLFILMAGGMGNLLNAWAYGERGHLSVGASTAVFGALGVIVGYRLIKGLRHTGRWRKRTIWIPLAAGLALLGFLGAGGDRTDILAHVWGFVAGVILVIPLALGWKPKAMIGGRPLQIVTGFLVFFLLAWAWIQALRVVE
ncbi:MAG: rhomboid family intramembrane serine protease [Opitutales bacterium]